jgi:hypothetical protein
MFEGIETKVVASSACNASSTSLFEGIVVISKPLDFRGTHSPLIRYLTLTVNPA